MKIILACFVVISTAVSAQPTFTSGMFGGVRARSIGPAAMSGRISDIAVVDTNPAIMYVGSAGGGVWKTMNGGTTFKAVFDEHNQSIGAIAIDQRHPDTIWVGTGESWVRNSVSAGDGLYRSTDGGVTWTHVGLGASERIARIVIDPKDPKTVYVAATGALWSTSEERGLYKTTDFGATWKKILYVDQRTGCADVAIDPKRPSTLIAGMWEFKRRPWTFQSGGPGSGLYRSTNGGTSWTRISKGMPPGDLGRTAIAFSPVDSKIVYANIEADSTGFFRSTDNGISWQRRFSGLASTIRPFYFSRIVADPVSKDRVWKTGLNLFRTDDGGGIWVMQGSSPHSDHHAIWIDPHDNDHVITCTDGGVYETRDRGRAWRFFGNLPVSQFYHVSVDDQRPYHVYGGLQDNGSWSAPSRKPGGIGNADWMMLGGGDGFHVVPDGKDPSIVFWESQGGNLNRLDRSSSEARSVQPVADSGAVDLRWNWNTPIVRPAKRPHVLYTGSQYVHRTTDRGVTWTVISPDLTTNDSTKLKQKESGGLSVDNSSAENHCTVVTIAESPLDSTLIWVGTDDGNLQVTNDGGNTWTNLAEKITLVPRNTWVSYVEPSPHDRRTVFVTFDGHGTGDMRTYVLKSTDLGRTWTMLDTAGLRGWAHVIRQDPVRANMLFLGTEHGFYVSLDAGASWAAFRNGIPPVAVRDMAFQEREADLVLATHGRGIYVVDDLEVLRAFDPKELASDLIVLPTKPAVRRLGAGGGAWFGGDEQYAGDDVNDDAAVWYVLRERHLRGKFEIAIIDAQGTTVRTVPGSPRRGINKVELPLRRKAPVTAQSDVGAAFGSYLGPFIAEGRYTVELRKGTDTTRTTLDIVTDTIYKHSAEDRRAQQDLIEQLFDLNEELAVSVARIRAVRDTLNARISSGRLAGAELDVIKTIRDTVASVNNSLVNSKVGLLTGEEQLRERLATLYGEVNGYLGRPSAAQTLSTKVLGARVAEGTTRVEEVLRSDVPRVNEVLTRAGMAPVGVEPRSVTERRMTSK